MESKGSLFRWLFIGVAVFLAMKFVGPKLFGSEGGAEIQPLTAESRKLPSARPAEKTCDIFTDRFNAVLSTRGASLKHFKLITAKYRR